MFFVFFLHVFISPRPFSPGWRASGETGGAFGAVRPCLVAQLSSVEPQPSNREHVTFRSSRVEQEHCRQLWIS